MRYRMITLACMLMPCMLYAEQFYVNAATGSDNNTGNRQQPLRSLQEAARRLHGSMEKGPTEIILSGGIHLLTSTVLFDNDRYTAKERLVIKADVMPDETGWTPAQMPVLVTIVPLHPGFGGDEAIGIQVEVSHVTIEGLRFSGSPDYSYKGDKELRRTYPVWRGGKDLDDLVVTQCLFAGDQDVLPLHVGVIANGQGLVLDHCVFYNCKNPVVFWQAGKGKDSYHNVMRYCLAYGCYFSGVWTTENTAGDFEFHHNVIAGCRTAWIREANTDRHYSASDCIFAQNQHLGGFGSGPGSKDEAGSLAFLKMENVKVVGSEGGSGNSGGVQIDRDQSHRTYLQLVPGTLGTELGAGLFKD